MMLTRTKLAVVLFAALATVACNGKPTPPPSNNSNAASNSNSGGVKATAVPTDQILNYGIQYKPVAGATYTKGFVVIETDLPASTNIDFRLTVKRAVGADVQKDVTLTAGKNVATIPLVSTELGKVTEISWKEKQVDPTQWVYKRHKTAEYNPGSGALYIATSDVTNLGEVDYCPGQVSTRGIFTTPIGLRVYLYQ